MREYGVRYEFHDAPWGRVRVSFPRLRYVLYAFSIDDRVWHNIFELPFDSESRAMPSREKFYSSVRGVMLDTPPCQFVRKPQQIQRLGEGDLLQKPGERVQRCKKHGSISLLCTRLRESPSHKKTPSTDFNHKFSGKFSR